MEISSLQNSLVKDLVRLQKKKHRDRMGKFLVEGQHLVEELKKTDWKYQTIGCLDNCDIRINQKVARKISESQSGEEVFALVDIPNLSLPQEARNIFILDRVQNPGNLGAIVRNAYSFGFDAVLLSDDSADLWSYKSLRASQGSIFHIPVVRMPLTKAIDWAESKGMRVYTADLLADSQSLFEFEGKNTAIILGSEGQGLSDLSRKRAQASLKIPMEEFDSLNVAVSSGIIAYQIYKNASD